MTTREFTPEEARAIGERIGIDWGAGDTDLEQFRMGLAVELEHGSQDPATDTTIWDVTTTGRWVCDLHVERVAAHLTITGTCGDETVDVDEDL